MGRQGRRYERWIVLPLALVLVAAMTWGCAEDEEEPEDTTTTTAPAAEPTEEDTSAAEELWQEIQDADYQANWASSPKGERYAGLEPHGIQVSLYLSDEAGDAFEQPVGETMPDGTIMVKENWQEDNLAYYTIMQKRSGYDPDNNDWFYAMISGEGEIQAAGRLGDCIGCHAAVRSNDFVYSFPVAPE
jgi:hypothetical protein